MIHNPIVHDSKQNEAKETIKRGPKERMRQNGEGNGDHRLPARNHYYPVQHEEKNKIIPNP